MATPTYRLSAEAENPEGDSHERRCVRAAARCARAPLLSDPVSRLRDVTIANCFPLRHPACFKQPRDCLEVLPRRRLQTRFYALPLHLLQTLSSVASRFLLDRFARPYPIETDTPFVP